MKKNKIIVAFSLFVIFSTAVDGFGADAVKPSVPGLPSAKTNVQSEPKTPSIPPMVQAPDNVYNYNPLGKPDPFRPFLDIEALTKKKAKVTKAKTESIFPLQRADASSFKLVGIVGDQMRRVAVLQDSAKRFYPIFVGTRIGTRDGKVTEILADRVTVDELEGKKIKRVILKLRNNI